MNATLATMEQVAGAAGSNPLNHEELSVIVSAPPTFRLRSLNFFSLKALTFSTVRLSFDRMLGYCVQVSSTAQQIARRTRRTAPKRRTMARSNWAENRPYLANRSR